VVFSIGVLAFGYLLFLGLVGWTGANMRAHLVVASDSLFPSALASQEANATFQKLTQDYKVAILTQNASLLDTAGEDAAEVAAELQTVREKNVYGPCHAVQGYLYQDDYYTRRHGRSAHGHREEPRNPEREYDQGSAGSQRHH
jgi:hypothetical protein